MEIYKIYAIVLSYNARENLKRLISALLCQTYSLSEIIVVDNASSDGTVQMLKEEFPQITLLANLSNLGVGAGYTKGMKYAFEKGADWIWLLDGDSFPDKTALEELISTFEKIKYVYSQIGILASSPINPLTNRRYPPLIWNNRLLPVSENLILSGKPLLVDSVISSGSLIKRSVIEQIGFPREDFFIDFVDHEYNLRARRLGFQILYVPQSIIYHEVGKTVIRRSLSRFGKKWAYGDHLPWRLYYIARNELYTYLYEFKDLRAVFYFFIIKLTKEMAAILLYNYPDKKERIIHILMGIRDGLKGKLGKVVAPEEEKKRNGKYADRQSQFLPKE
jgi:GT2 family glycosyltransferase